MRVFDTPVPFTCSSEVVGHEQSGCGRTGGDLDVSGAGHRVYDNYPGGTGLTNAAVYGRIAAETVADEGDPLASGGAAGEATADD